MKQQYGIGLESEGFIIDENEKPISKIENIPSSEWLMTQMREKNPRIANENLSFEQASIMLEVKTDLFTEGINAVSQILEIRDLINQVLPNGLSLSFTAVPKRHFTFEPATSDPNSRCVALLKRWGTLPNGERLLKSTAVASLQINDSRPFEGLSEMEKLEKSRRLHNIFSSSFDELSSHNPIIHDYEGLTRIDRLKYLLQEINGQKFLNKGFQDTHAVIPPYFEDIEQMKRWLCVFSDTDSFEEADPKNEHSITIKIKRQPKTDYWAMETRIFDAVDTEQEMMSIIHKVSEKVALSTF